MSLSDVAIRRPVFTSMMALCLVVLGTIGLKRLGTDLYPDVSFPVVLVTTPYRGAGPGEIETQVVKPIEDAVAGINQIDHMHSFSRENVGIVMVQFDLAANLDRSVQEVRDRVAGVIGKLPKNVDTPVVSRVDISASPILTYAVSANLESQKLHKLIDDRVRPALAQLDGVADVRIIGGDVREIHVDVDLQKARAAGVSPTDISQRIGRENLNLPAGHMSLGPSELTVRSLGEFRDIDELKRLLISRGATGVQVRLDEVATVSDSVVERRTLARLNSTDAIIVEVVKQAGSDTDKVCDQGKARLAEISPSLGHDFKTRLIIDQSLLIRENAREVWVALVFGGLMAIVIILLFLLDPRGTFISSLALPTSVIGTFFVMFLFGYSLNQMTLLALSLAIGLLIDDAVVVREAITHRLERGEGPMEAASKGTQEVGLAVLATTLSLVAVFIPVAFMPGIIGQFFRQFGITISVAVLISLFISFTVDPMLSARLVKARKPGQERTENIVFKTIRSAFDAMERAYGRTLAWTLDHKLATLAITFGLLIITFVGARGLGAEFLSPEDRSQFLIDLKLPNSASLSETTQRVAEAETIVRGIPEVTDTYSIVGLYGEVNKGRLRVLTVDKNRRKRGIAMIKEDARSRLTPVLQATQINLADPPIIEGLGDYFPIMVRVTGPDLVRVRQEAGWIAKTLNEIPGTADVRVEDTPPRPELQVQINRVRAGDRDLSATMLALQLRLALDGDVAARLREGTDETDIRVRLDERDRATPDMIQNLDIVTPQGLQQVKDVADVSLNDGPSVIEHENRERQIAVYAQLGKGAALGNVATQLKARVSAHERPPGYSVIYDGQIKSFKEQNDAFSWALGLAFIFIFMVLASQFESLIHPFTIMASLPLALIGALIALLVTKNHLSMGAMIGIILLMGLVTKNAILLVDGALQNIRAGDDVRTALLKAGPRRLRPILMTSAAMALGMLPTAMGKGVGAEFRSPMAISVIGGVITSTSLTLLVVPVVFTLVEKMRLTLLFKRRPRPVAIENEVFAPDAEKAA